MQTICLIMLFVLLSHGSATHIFKTIENHHYVPHHKTHSKEIISVHKSLPPPIPIIAPSDHAHVLHKPLPPPTLPLFPPKPIHKHHDKKLKYVPPIVKPVPVPVPVLVPVKIPSPPLKHHVPLDIALKPFAPFAKGHEKIKGYEHIKERYIH